MLGWRRIGAGRIVVDIVGGRDNIFGKSDVRYRRGMDGVSRVKSRYGTGGSLAGESFTTVGAGGAVESVLIIGAWLSCVRELRVLRLDASVRDGKRTDGARTGAVGVVGCID